MTRRDDAMTKRESEPMIPWSEMDYRRNTAFAITSAIEKLFESDAVLACLTDDLHMAAANESDRLRERFAEKGVSMDNEVNTMLRQLMVVSILCREIVAWARHDQKP